MAEAAGLAIGTVALIGVFTDCIDLLNLISASRSLGRDFEIIDTKFDIEKLLFFQWAARVRLLDDNYDPRLNNSRVRTTVEKTLASIRLLFQESRTLQNRYGLKRAKDNQENDVGPPISVHRMDGFTREFEALALRISTKQKDVSQIKKIRWAVVDKDKFSDLIKELAYFVAKLNDVLPTDHKTMAAMAREDVRGIPTLGQLHLVFDAAKEEDKEDLVDQAKQVICEKRILQQIWYRTMDDRRDIVGLPYSKTLGWVLDSLDSDTEWYSLPEWLQSGTGIYWLSGKAGSGKSTLMKHLCTDRRTRSLLKAWATPGDSTELIIESFFFYNLGTPQQKSQEGLWRAILYKILNSDSSLVPELLPNMWRDVYDSGNTTPDLPSDAEVSYAFSRLVQIHGVQTHNLQSQSREMLNRQAKFCFFIDGLDEYSGNYTDAIDLINRLATSPSIKIVVSSRPIPACVAAYSIRPKMMLHDLTKPDIETYARDKVLSHPQADDILYEHGERATALVNDLVEKSSGVFLWVVLACKSIHEGFTAYDDISDLERRIDELPPELEKLFQHMLGNISPRYREEAAMVLWLCNQRHLVPDTKPLSCLGLGLMSDFTVEVKQLEVVRDISQEKKRKICKTMEGRLRSRCCGLLEIVSPRKHDPRDCFCDVENQIHTGMHDDLVDSTVSFIHKSVLEFLQTPKVQSLDCLKVQNDDFSPSAILSRMSCQLIALSYYSGCKDQADTYLQDTLLYANQCGESQMNQTAAVLNLLEGLLSTHKEPSFPSIIGIIQTPVIDKAARLRSKTGSKGYGSTVLDLAIEGGLVGVVRTLQRTNSSEVGNILESPQLLQRALLRPALRDYIALKNSWPYPHPNPEMLCHLLLSGCNAKENIEDFNNKNTTPWKLWTTVLRWLPERSLPTHSRRNEIIKCFIESGATIDLNSLGGNWMENFKEWLLHERLNPSSKKLTQESACRIIEIINDQTRPRRSGKRRHETFDDGNNNLRVEETERKRRHNRQQSSFQIP